MRKLAMTLVLIIGLAGNVLSAPLTVSTASDSWRLELRASVGTAETRLTVGQSPDASDSKDGLYDVPALLSGDIMAYITLGEDKYWQDIKKTCTAPCRKTWDIAIESPLVGSTISLRWSPPAEDITLTDMSTGQSIDMKTISFYKYNNKDGRRAFRVEVGR